jgi:TonB family protein
MFNNLVESELHVADMKRRGTFLFATMFVYALLLAGAGVVSIYAYEARLNNQSLEMTALVTMVPLSAAPPKVLPEHSAVNRARSSPISDSNARVATRTMRLADVNSMEKVPTSIGVTGNSVPPMPPGGKIGPANIDIGDGHGDAPFARDGVTGNQTADSGGGIEVTRDTPPEMPGTETRPPRKPPLVSLGVIESKVTQKAVPPYPELAKRARASGPVTVQILLDEQGKVISARATNGHPLLRAAAEQAAYQTRFSPTLLSNQPVKVSGIITFNFVLQ